MTQVLKQSTAVDVLIGPFVDKTDGATAETGESPSVKLSKNGQALAAKSDVTTPLHDADGYYNCELDATDTNTVGTMILTVAASANALPVRHEFQVVEEATYDALFGASATGFDASGRVDVGSWLGTAAATPTVAGVPEVDMTHLGGVAQSATDLKDFADAGYDPATNKVQGVVLVDTTTTNTDMRGTDNAALASVLGALADAAAAGDPTTTDTVMQYLKQLVNVLVGTTGVTIFPAEAAPANNVSLSEVIRAIHSDVTGLNGDAMRGTDSAFLASSAPTNFSSMSITAGGLVDITQAAADKVFGSSGATLSELPQAAPSATPRPDQALMMVHMALRNKVDITSTLKEFHNDAGTVVFKKTLSDDGTTYSEAEMVTGP